MFLKIISRTGESGFMLIVNFAESKITLEKNLWACLWNVLEISLTELIRCSSSTKCGQHHF